MPTVVAGIQRRRAAGVPGGQPLPGPMTRPVTAPPSSAASGLSTRPATAAPAMPASGKARKPASRVSHLRTRVPREV